MIYKNVNQNTNIQIIIHQLMDNDYYDFLDHSYEQKPRKKTCRALTDQEILLREKEKLVKNRESAKNSRKRKKIYVDLLENKVNLLTQQLNAHKELQEQSQQFLKEFQLQLIVNHYQKQNKVPRSLEERISSLNHHSQEIYAQSIPKLAENLSNDTITPILKGFQETFLEIETVKDQMILELKKCEQTMQDFKALPGFEKFAKKLETCDFKEELNSLEEVFKCFIRRTQATQ